MTEDEEHVAFNMDAVIAIGQMKERKTIVASLLTGCQKKALETSFHALQEAGEMEYAANLMRNFGDVILKEIKQ